MEWIQFLKTGEIETTATAKGLPEARERLRVASLSVADRQAYERDMEAFRYQRSVIKTGWIEGRAEGIKEGRAEGIKEGRTEGLKEGIEQGERKKQLEIACNLKRLGMPVDTIAQATHLSSEEIERLVL